MAGYFVYFKHDPLPAGGTETQVNRLLKSRNEKNVQSLKEWLEKQHIADKIKIISSGDPLNDSVIVDTDVYGSIQLSASPIVQNIAQYKRVTLI